MKRSGQGKTTKDITDMVTEYKRQILNGGIKALLVKLEISEKIEDYE